MLWGWDRSLQIPVENPSRETLPALPRDLNTFNLKTAGDHWKFESWEMCSIWRFLFTDSSDGMGMGWKCLVRTWFFISSSPPWPMAKASDTLWRAAQEISLSSSSQSPFQVRHIGSVLWWCIWNLFLYQLTWSAVLWMICLVLHFGVSSGKYLRSSSIPSPVQPKLPTTSVQGGLKFLLSESKGWVVLSPGSGSFTYLEIGGRRTCWMAITVVWPEMMRVGLGLVTGLLGWGREHWWKRYHDGRTDRAIICLWLLIMDPAYLFKLLVFWLTACFHLFMIVWNLGNVTIWVIRRSDLGWILEGWHQAVISNTTASFI